MAKRCKRYICKQHQRSWLGPECQKAHGGSRPDHQSKGGGIIIIYVLDLALYKSYFHLCCTPSKWNFVSHARNVFLLNLELEGATFVVDLSNVCQFLL